MYDLIVVDTREKGNKNILKYFDQINQNYVISKLDAGDYMLYKKYDIIIDKKDGLLELAHNLCNTLEHQRINREIKRAKQLGCQKFVFLIQDNKIKSINDVENWSSPHTKVKGSVLLKIMKTIKQKYNVNFMIVPKKKMGEYIVKLLGGDK